MATWVYVNTTWILFLISKSKLFWSSIFTMIYKGYLGKFYLKLWISNFRLTAIKWNTPLTYISVNLMWLTNNILLYYKILTNVYTCVVKDFYRNQVYFIKQKIEKFLIFSNIFKMRLFSFWNHATVCEYSLIPVINFQWWIFLCNPMCCDYSPKVELMSVTSNGTYTNINVHTLICISSLLLNVWL